MSGSVSEILAVESLAVYTCNPAAPALRSIALSMIGMRIFYSGGAAGCSPFLPLVLFSLSSEVWCRNRLCVNMHVS